MISVPGLYEIESGIYHSDPAPSPSLSNSLIGALLEAPALARERHPRLNPLWEPSTPTPQQVLGTIAHKLLLEEGGELSIIQADDYRTKDAREQRDQIIASGGTPVLLPQLQKASVMVAAIEGQLHDFEGLKISDFKTGKREVGLFWQDAGGVWCRNLIDWFRDDQAVTEVWDMKFSGVNINPEGMALSIHFVEMGYATQCAMQERGLISVFPQLAGRLRFRRMFQSTEPPYLISVVEPDPATMTMARKQVEYAIQKWGYCLRGNSWPGYPKRVVMLRHAEFLATRWLDREIAEFDAGQLAPPPAPALKKKPGRPKGSRKRKKNEPLDSLMGG